MKQTYEGKLADLKARNASCKLERTGFPFSASRPPSKEELLSLVPRQELVDLLVDGYFRNYDPLFRMFSALKPAIHEIVANPRLDVLHRPSFYKQYEDFWRDPTQVDIIWLGLLMSIMGISLRIYSRSGEEPPELAGRTVDMSYAFKLATEQCLIVGDYTKKLYIHTVQTMILLSTQHSHKDRAEDSWILLGSLVRVALAMGLHRDPKKFGTTISPGEGEIRKRLWTIIYFMDVLESIKIGLPHMIRLEECDVSLPLNLHDDEICEEVTVLPPERKQSELTGVSYMIAKASLTRTYSKIVSQASSFAPRPLYDHILKMDTELREQYEKVPSFLHMRSTEESKNDPGWLVIQRHSLSLLTHKALVILHRPYAARAKGNPRYQNSRRKCVEAAVTLLKHQSEIFLESQGLLRHARWFTETLGCHDFLHAAMILCLDLSTTCKEFKDEATKKGVHVDYETWKEGRSEEFRVLGNTKVIFEDQKENSMDCLKAHGVLCVLLDKLKGDSTRDFGLSPNNTLDRTASIPVTSTQLATTEQKSSSVPPQVTPFSAINTQALTSSLSTSLENVDPLNDPMKGDKSAALALGMMGSGLPPGMAFERAPTPGGTNVLMLDAASSGYGSPGPNGTFSASPALWVPSGMDMPANLDWVCNIFLDTHIFQQPVLTCSGKDDWDSFMQGISMDAGQSVWPVLPSVGTSALNPMAPGGIGVNGDGGGRDPQQSPGVDVVSPGTIPGYQLLGTDKTPIR